MYNLADIQNLIESTVEEFYSLDERRRSFITDLVKNKNVKWSRIELMKMLMIYNKSIELNCSITSPNIITFSSFIDNNSQTINNLLKEYDFKYRIMCGVSV